MQYSSVEESLFQPPGSVNSPTTYYPVGRPDLPHSLPNQPTMALDYDQSYKSLFQGGTEVPRFVVPYQWWEDDAMTIMWAFNAAEISLVIRFGLYRNRNFPREMLRQRNESAIDRFLLNLADPREQQLLSTLSHTQRVEEILRRSTVHHHDLVPWGWFPPLPGHGLDPKVIALAIEAESHYHFKRMTFEDIVRISLGYYAPSVEWFMAQHTAFYCYLKDHLKAYPDEFPLYVEVERVRVLNRRIHRFKKNPPKANVLSHSVFEPRVHMRGVLLWLVYLISSLKS